MSGLEVLHGDAAEPVCSTGYTATTTDQLLCLDGEIQGALACAGNPCPSLPLENGRTCAMEHNASACTLICDPGYAPSGATICFGGEHIFGDPDTTRDDAICEEIRCHLAPVVQGADVNETLQYQAPQPTPF